MRYARLVTLAAVLACAPADPNDADRPNFLVILADDLGFSDLGFLGSEIRTPNLDALAAEGVVLTRYYVAPTCAPTRAMLLTGTDTHPAGMGTQGPGAGRQQGQVGYEGYLTDRVVTVASLLRDAGYHTSTAGKWHLGVTPDRLPHRRGFERSFGVPAGGAGHFSDAAPMLEGYPATYREDGVEVSLPDDFFSTNYYTDKLIEYVTEASESGRPFFAYAAYTAPHWPLQAPDDFIDRYRGVYDEGYDSLRAQRVWNLIEQGVVPDVPTPDRLPWVPAWDSLTDDEKQVEARRMEVYAAMVENLDYNIGRLVDHLKRNGLFENTVIIFSSDNGAEGNDIGTMGSNAEWIPANFDNRVENMGRIDSYVWRGPGWAQAQTAPLRLFKAFATEGGVRTPVIIRYGRFASRRSDAFASVKDIMPTLLELAGVQHPTSYAGREVVPMQGVSMVPFLSGQENFIHDDPVMGWELYGRSAILKDNWKLVFVWEPYGSERWELYDLTTDPTESRDRSGDAPEKLRELQQAWDEYVEQNGVIIPARDRGYGLVTGMR